MSDFVWSDPDWLNFYSLNQHTALDYFSRSSFYDLNCNNEVIRQRGLDLSKLVILPPGIEYVLHDFQEPHLFVVHKQQRHSPKATTSLTFYYILDGKIYQAPPMHAAMSSRMSRSLFHIKAAFKRIQDDIDPLKSLSLESEAKKAEDDTRRLNMQPQRSQETKERARQINGIIHSVLQSHASKLPQWERADLIGKENGKTASQIKEEDRGKS